MITFLGSLVQCIGQTFCANFIQIVIFLYISLSFFFAFFISIIVSFNLIFGLWYFELIQSIN